MKRKGGGPIEEEEDGGNGTPSSSLRNHRPKNPTGTATGTRIETAQEGSSPLRVTSAVVEEEQDKTARALLTEDGYDPEDLNKVDNMYGYTSLIYYSRTGNVTMVRYLILRDADGQTTDRDGCPPMQWAAANGHVEILKLLSLFAHEDIVKPTRNGDTPVRIAFLNDHFEVVYWLLRNGALAPTPTRFDWDGGRIHDLTMRTDLLPTYGTHGKGGDDKRRTVLSWARKTVATKESAKVYFTTEATVFSRTLELLEQTLQTLRPLIRLLSAFIAEVPFVVEEEVEDKNEDEDKE